jgi:glutathione S-transferase
VLVLLDRMSDLSPSQMEATQKYLLLSICYSHFNEKARWAMSYYRVQYTHQLLLPFFHMFTIKPIVDSGVSKHESRDNLSSPFSTPCLALYEASGKELEESFHDSHDILVHLSETFSNAEHVNLYKSCGPENEEKIYTMEKHYDEVIGAAVIDLAYHDLLVENKWSSILPFATIGFKNRVGVLQSLFWFGLSPFLGRMIMSFRAITPDKYEKAMETLRHEFSQASECKCYIYIASAWRPNILSTSSA